VSLFKDPNAGRAPRAPARTTETRPKKRTRTAKRNDYWTNRVNTAANGFIGLGDACSWLRAELYRIEETRPADAEPLAQYYALQIAEFARTAHKMKAARAA
jgi:hypothetical protein